MRIVLNLWMVSVFVLLFSFADCGGVDEVEVGKKTTIRDSVYVVDATDPVSDNEEETETVDLDEGIEKVYAKEEAIQIQKVSEVYERVRSMKVFKVLKDLRASASDIYWFSGAMISSVVGCMTKGKSDMRSESVSRGKSLQDLVEDTKARRKRFRDDPGVSYEYCYKVTDDGWAVRTKAWINKEPEGLSDFDCKDIF